MPHQESAPLKGAEDVNDIWDEITGLTTRGELGDHVVERLRELEKLVGDMADYFDRLFAGGGVRPKSKKKGFWRRWW